MTTWKYLHTAATPPERDEITLLLLQRLHARRSRVLLVNGRLIHERRVYRSYAVHERRDPRTRAYLPVQTLAGWVLTAVVALLAATQTDYRQSLALLISYGLALCYYVIGHILWFSHPETA